jgi:hypothetical protein
MSDGSVDGADQENSCACKIMVGTGDLRAGTDVDAIVVWKAVLSTNSRGGRLYGLVV